MKRATIFHPVLFAVYIVLFVYAHNFEFAPSLGVVAGLLVTFAAVAACLWGLLTLATRNAEKAAIASSALVLLFISYGHIENLITEWSWGAHIFSIEIGYKKMAAALCLASMGAVTAWLWRASRDATRGATTVLNRIAGSLILFSVAHLFTVGLMAEDWSSAMRQHRSARAARSVTRGDESPDIYYIILDAYGRTDTLRELYGYDNRPFIEWLQAKGFYVAKDSHSNYSQTMLSLGSSLNFTYLNSGELKAADTTDPRWHVELTTAAVQLLNAAHENLRLPLAHLIQRNRVADTLRQHGYRFVAFTSGYGGVQFPDADIERHAAVLSDFAESLLSTTPIPDVAARLYDQQELHRKRIRYIFDHVADPVDGGGPSFVFAHILSPHSPFVFKSDGAPVDRTSLGPHVFYDEELELKTGADRQRVVTSYRGQIDYVTRRVQGLVETILARSTRRPIIIIQGDHGPNLGMRWEGSSAAAISERMSILNAVYAPAEIRDRLYPSITPVNTFRVILNEDFGVRAPLLPDKSYFSEYDAPYDFRDVSALLSR